MDNRKIAVLIDAENISYKNAHQIIDIMSAKGDVIIKEIIADWTRIAKGKISSPGLYHREKQIDGWRKEASLHSMTAVQQFSYVSGKNTSDIALTISAMKILFEKPFVDVFCIVSNDSDFTRLAQELREHNKEVVGMGERQRAIPEFVNAFSEFVYLGEAIEEGKDTVVEDTKQSVNIVEKETAAQDTKLPENSPQEPEEQAKSNDKKSKKTQNKVSDATKNKENAKKKKKSSKLPQESCILPPNQLADLKDVIEDILSEHDGIAFYSLIAIRMKQQYPDFVPANYDCRSISALLDKIMPFMPEYILHKQPMPNNPNGFIMMLKRRK